MALTGFLGDGDAGRGVSFSASPFPPKHKRDFHPGNEGHRLCLEAPPLSGLPGAPLPGAPTGVCPVHVRHAPRGLERQAGPAGLMDGAWQARPAEAPENVFHRRQRDWE